ncbi:unnamed protein product [Rhizophagus irregularis]|nr:unnamed protein product [Rhizophagus irregularis]
MSVFIKPIKYQLSQPAEASKETSTERTPKETSKPVAHSESPTTSRPVTPTLPSFSQSANVINVTINNNYAGAPDEQE